MTDFEVTRPKKEKARPKRAAKQRRGPAKATRAVKARGLMRQILTNPLEALKAATRRKLELILAQSLSVGEVAEMLATTTSVVERRIRARSLYAIPVAGTWRIPKFQFHHDEPIRGMEDVWPRLDADLHPLEVHNWLSLPNPDLVMRGKSVSPIKWLENGGDAGAVAELAAEVGSGL